MPIRRDMKLGRKGQALTPDFIAGITIFGFLLVFGTTMFFSTASQTAEFREVEELQRQSIDVLDAMVRTPGSPGNWTNSTVRIVGLVTDDHTLDPAKLVELKSVPTAKLQAIFGIGESKPYLTIENDTSVITYNGTVLSYGTSVPANATRVIYTTRKASLTVNGNRTTVTIKMNVWR